MAEHLTRLLHNWRAGDAASRDLLLGRCTTRCAAWLRRGRPGHTLQPTAVVNEALLRLLGHEANWQDRAHFFALTALKMRACWSTTPVPTPPTNAAVMSPC